MTEKELLKEYPLLNDNSMKLPKASIINLIGKDEGKDLTDDRGFLIEYCDESADNDDDMFFWEMLRCTKFILEGATAYTTPNHVISLNYPCTDIIPMDNDRFRRWYFVYCHECLHQLWDTFEVADEIKETQGSCDYQLLNVASDCVINDYLENIAPNNKLKPTQGIFPDVLEKDYGVTYDRKVDTQYSLYLKLLDIKKELQDKLKQMADDVGGESQQGQQGSGQGGNQKGNQSSQNSSDKQKAAEEAQQHADKAKEAAQNGDEETAKKEAEAAGKAAEKAGADKEGKEAQNTSGKSADEAAKDAQKAADAAKKAADGDKGKGEGKDDEGNESNGTGGGNQADKDDEGNGNGKGKQAGNDDGNLDLRDLEQECKNAAEKILKKYKDSLTGPMGDFINKCNVSKKLKKDGLMVNAVKGSTNWNKQVMITCKKYIKQKLQHIKQYQRTYTRIKRGERAFTKSDFANGRMIVKGKKEIKQKIGFDINLYIDVSGSMSDCIDTVFDAAYSICNDMKSTFGKEQIVDKDKVALKSFVFTTKMREIEFGKKCEANGGTYAFGDLLSDVSDRGDNAFVNIIITDGNFGSVDKNKIAKALEKMEGLFVMVTNNKKGTFDSVVRHVKQVTKKEKLSVIYTEDFNITA